MNEILKKYLPGIIIGVCLTIAFISVYITYKVYVTASNAQMAAINANKMAADAQSKADAIVKFIQDNQPK